MSFPMKRQIQKIIGEFSWFEINAFRDKWAFPFFFFSFFFNGVFLWSLTENDCGGGAMDMEGYERVIAYEKKKRKEANEWPVKGVRILVRCVVEGSGVGGVTRVAP